MHAQPQACLEWSNEARNKQLGVVAKQRKQTHTEATRVADPKIVTVKPIYMRGAFQH